MISTHCCARTTAGHAALPLRTPKNSRRPISTLLSRRRHPNGSIQLHGRGQIRAALVVSRGDGQSPLWSKMVLTPFKWDVCATPERHRSGPLFVVVQPAKWFNLGFNRGALFSPLEMWSISLRGPVTRASRISRISSPCPAARGTGESA
jgi:hypothetical protein